MLITPRKKAILEYMKKYFQKNSYSPSLEETAKHFKLAKSTIHQHVEELKEAGYLEKEDYRARAIELKNPRETIEFVEIPLVGTITAGEPIEAIELSGDTIAVPKNDIKKIGNYYALRVKGNSMIEEGIFDGDIVVLREQKVADNGQTVVAIIDENQATLKKIYREKGRFRLQPANQALFPLYRNELEIRGLVVKVIRNFNEFYEEVIRDFKLNKFTNKVHSDSHNLKTIKDNYRDLKAFLDKLNFDRNHFVNSNDICTPMGCVEEMVNSLPQNFWLKKNLKILDPCAGNGNFHGYIAQKTDLKNLWFNDINKKRIENIKRIFGEDVNVIEEDFLAFKDKEEYDLVVANPPYAKFTDGKRAAKNHNLSREFILKALNVTKRDGYILFIVPDNWMSYADSNKLPLIISNYQLIHLDIHGAKKWFPKVGSSFSWFLLKKSPNKAEFTVNNNYKIKRVERARLDKGVRFIPLYCSNIVKSILNKTIHSASAKYAIQTSSNLHKYTQRDLLVESKDRKHPYKINHTPTQVVWSERPHVYQEGWKVFISLTNQYSNFVDNSGMTQSIAFIRCTSKEEAERISKELSDEVYVFLNNITRYGNFNNIRVLQNFPIYKDFKLTKKEIDFIREFNLAYRNPLLLRAKNRQLT